MMNCYSKEQRVSPENEGRDRLSELPDDILVHILSFLSIVDAVRTVLIRRFGELWTLLPSLQFYEFDFREEVVSEEEVENEENCCRPFANFVRNALILHKKTPIDMFMIILSFDYEDGCKPYALEFTNWIRFAVDRQVKELIVELNIDLPDIKTDGYILPRCLFTSQFLITLKLEDCQIQELNQVHMRSLRKLSLSNVVVSNETFKKIILGSPSLQEVDLNLLLDLNEVHFSNPSIEKLRLGFYHGLLDCPNLKFLEFHSPVEHPMQVVNVSSLRKVNIGFCFDLNDLHQCLKEFCNVELFELSDAHALHQLSEIIDLELLQTRWKCLRIRCLLLGDEFSGLCRLLRSSPNLEELVVCKDSLHHPGIHLGTQTTNMLSRDLPSCLMQHLKIVTMCGYEVPCHGLLQLAEYLLKSCVILEKMVILPGKNKSSAVDEQNFVEQLLRFPRASTNARLIFGSEVY